VRRHYNHNASPDQFKQYSMIADPQAVLVLAALQLFDITAEILL
jgi:hypothetical protein